MLVCRVGTGVGVGVGVGIGVGVGVGDELGVGVGDGLPGVGVGVGPEVTPPSPWQPVRTKTTLKRKSQKTLFPMVIETNFAQESPGSRGNSVESCWLWGWMLAPKAVLLPRLQPG